MCEGECGEHSNNQSGAVIRFGSLRSLLNLGSIQCNRERAELHLYETRGTQPETPAPTHPHTDTPTHTIRERKGDDYVQSCKMMVMITNNIGVGEYMPVL